jgi:hypothetical protein
VKTRIGRLILGSLAVWLVALYPAQVLGGRTALVYCTVALGLCLVPTVVSLALVSRAARWPPEYRLAIILGGTGVRMALVLGVGLVLNRCVDGFDRPSFWVWLLVFYLTTLTLETSLLVAGGVVTGEP